MSCSILPLTNPFSAVTSSSGSCCWNGKQIFYKGLKNTMLLTGALIAGFGVYEIVLPQENYDIPSEMTGTISLIASTLLCTGGMCLCKLVPYKMFEETVGELKEVKDQLKKEKEEFIKSNNELQVKVLLLSEQNSNLKKTLTRVFSENGKLTVGLQQLGTELNTASEALANSTLPLNQANSEIGQNCEILSDKLADTENLIIQIHNAKNRTTTSSDEEEPEEDMALLKLAHKYTHPDVRLL